MDRRDSFSSCKSDSDYDGDSYAGSYSDLAAGDIHSGGERSRHAPQSADSPSPGDQTRRPTTPQSRDRLQRRLGGIKRQAPQPPARPPVATVAQSTPITTVHLQFEPVIMPQPTTPSGTPAPVEQTRKISKIISESVDMAALFPAATSAASVPAKQQQIGYQEVSRPMSPSQPVPSNQMSPPIPVPSNQVPAPQFVPVGQMSPQERPMSPTRQMIPIQRVVCSNLVPFSSSAVDPSSLINPSMSPPPQQVLSTGSLPMTPNRPMLPTRPMSPSRPMSPPPRPMSPPPRPLSSTGDTQMVLRGGIVTPVQNQSRLPPLCLDQNQVMSPRGELVTSAAYDVPQPYVVPRAPQRSSSSQAATQHLGNRRIRLIDEESDSEAYQSDATEDLRDFQGGRPLHRRTSAGSGGYPSRHQQNLVNDPMCPTLLSGDPMTNSQDSYDFYSSFDESSLSEVGSEPGVLAAAEVQPTLGMRGRARRLAHSPSDPGMSRPQRLPHLQQHPRAPGVASPPPLDQLSEEDVGQSDYEDREQEDQILGPGLKRTESMVTVAHLNEDVLVSSRLRIRVTLTNLTVVAVVVALVLPNTAIMLYTAFRLVFGTLFPAYYSYKAVKTKNVKEYVKWMMYWIVFAFFTCFETFTDLFLSFWFPFYYELKILVVLWLLSPATRGSSILYRKFVHPWLTRREDDIDNCIAQAKQQGYSTVIQLGTKGVNYATTVLMQTAIKASQGHQGGGGIVNQLRRSYSSGELSDGGDMNRNVKALPHIPDDNYDEHTHSSGPYESETRVRAESDAAYRSRGSSVTRGVRSNKTRSADVTDFYQDADEAVQRRRSPRTQDTASRVLSADDLTSGYSSGDPDAGDLIYDLSHETMPNNNLEIISEPKKSSKVRRTQSLTASTLNNHRSHRVIVRRGGEGREGLRSGNSAGRGSGPVDDLVAPASYSSSGHPAASHHGSSFKRSRPGEISAYATLPRTGNKRTAAAKKRQV